MGGVWFVWIWVSATFWFGSSKIERHRKSNTVLHTQKILFKALRDGEAVSLNKSANLTLGTIIVLP